jgi:hypothetical protein
MFNVGDFVINTQDVYDVFSEKLIQPVVFCILYKYKFLSIIKYTCVSKNFVSNIVLNDYWIKLND